MHEKCIYVCNGFIGPPNSNNVLVSAFPEFCVKPDVLGQLPKSLASMVSNKGYIISGNNVIYLYIILLVCAKITYLQLRHTRKPDLDCKRTKFVSQICLYPGLFYEV